MGQLQQLSDSLERARAQYDSANAQLAQIQRELRENRHELTVGKAEPARRASERSRSGSSRSTRGIRTSTLEVILGAKSLDDMITRMDSARSVTALDARILSQVRTFRTAVNRHGTLLAQCSRGAGASRRRACCGEASIESKIAEQSNLLSSLKGQIAQMVAADAARQLQMARRRRRDSSPNSHVAAATGDHGRRRLGGRTRR